MLLSLGAVVVEVEGEGKERWSSVGQVDQLALKAVVQGRQEGGGDTDELGQDFGLALSEETKEKIQCAVGISGEDFRGDILGIFL